MLSRAPLTKEVPTPKASAHAKSVQTEQVQTYFGQNEPELLSPQFAYSLADIRTFAEGESNKRPEGYFANRRLPFPIQAKLTVGAVNDPLEAEADRVADQVMRMPAQGTGSHSLDQNVSAGSVPKTSADADRLQRKCDCGGACDDCKSKDKHDEHAKVQMKSSGPSLTGGFAAPPIVHEVLGSPGQPLDASIRAFMEPRFGHDFSRVRIHSGTAAGQSAREVNAFAYTVGQNIIFGPNRFSPSTQTGQRLLAHELTHVVQQSGVTPSRVQSSRETLSTLPVSKPVQTSLRTSPNYRAQDISKENNSIPFTPASRTHLQRACGPAQIGSQANCIGRGGDITNFGGDSGKIFQFRVNCDEFLPGEEARVGDLATRLDSNTTMHIDGFASEEGPGVFNEDLSCARAKALELALYGAGVSSSRISMLYKHGATPGDRPFHRSAVVTIEGMPSPEAAEDCGQFIGSCEFYLCRERQGHCGKAGYYEGYGNKYCQRFTHLATRLSAPGRDWVRKTLRCLQEYIDKNIPIDTPCPRVKQMAFDSHPTCYVQSGVCFLDPSEMGMILDTIDPQDNDLKQMLITAMDCAANLAPVGLFPQTSLAPGGGFRGLMERDRQRTRRLMQPPPVGR